MPNRKRSPVTWESYTRDIGSNIQRHRVERGYSQERVAYEARLSRYIYQKLEKGESRPGDPAKPRLQTLLVLRLLASAHQDHADYRDVWRG